MQTLTLPNEVLFEDIRRQIQGGHTVTFTVRGWSMRPFLEHERDRVLVGAIPERGVQVGDAVLAQEVHGRYILHRVVEIRSDGSCILWGDGNIMGREVIAPGQVIGVVLGFYRPTGLRGPERFFSADGEAWQHYSRWWMAKTPRQRRYWLLAYRILFKLRIIK